MDTDKRVILRDLLYLIKLVPKFPFLMPIVQGLIVLCHIYEMFEKTKLKEKLKKRNARKQSHSEVSSDGNS